MDKQARVIELDTLDKYSGTVYDKNTICRQPSTGSRSYFAVLLNTKIELARTYASGAKVLDLCCGTGEHILALSPYIDYGVGLDFSRPFIEEANVKRTARGVRNVEFVKSNAKKIPFGDNWFDLVYSFSSLYYIPTVGQVVNEVSRVLRSGGIGILEMGNLYSLNTLVARAHPELAHPCHIPVREMKKIILSANMDIIKHRVFQILPLWGDRPVLLKPLLVHSVWKWILQHQIKGKMLDEWICSLPVFKYLAFRHIFICRKQR